MASSRGLLDGVRVVSLGAFVAGNVCALLLAELGADVVKIESPGHPEALRSYDAPELAEVFEPSGVRTTALFAGLTRSVRGVAIDLKSAEGRAVLRSLIGEAHVVVENLAPGTLAEWDCTFAALRAVQPQLVMLSMSGYGQTGPFAAYRAYASNIANHVGLTDAWATDGTHFDFIAAVHGANAVVAALAAVERGAPGVAIDLAQTEAAATVMAPLYLDYLGNGRPWAVPPNVVPGSLLSGVFRCQGDDAWVAVDIEDEDDAARLTGVLGARSMEDWAAARPPAQAAEELQAAGVAAAPVQNNADLWRDPQLRARGGFTQIVHPDLGPIEYPANPCRLDVTPGVVRRPGPRLGEHTAEVLAEWLGVGADEMATLCHRGAVWHA